MTTPINKGRFADQFRNLFGIKGRLALSLIPDVMPVMEIDSESPESFFTRDEFLLASWQHVGLVALRFSYAAVINPADSGRLVIIERAFFSSVTPIGMQIIATSVIPADADVLPGVRDSRVDGVKIPGNALFGGASRFRFGTAPASLETTSQGLKSYAGAAQREVDAPFVVEPGFCFYMQSEAVATAFDMAVRWRERENDARY